VRTFLPTVQTLAEQRMKAIVNGIATAMGCSADVDYQRRYPATINTPKESSIAASAAAEIAGTENVDLQAIPCMGSEDFAFMLQKCPGCYIWAGNGPCIDGRVLHNGRYNFNDDLLPVGASYWARLTESCL
jgi:hippurate hydrolase